MDERMERGRAKGRALLGHRWDRIEAALNQADPEFARYVVEVAYGDVYQRPGLDDRSRELVSVTCLTMLGLQPQLKTHVLAARAAGVTDTELVELFIHMALYVGFPTALVGLQTAREVIQAEGSR